MRIFDSLNIRGTPMVISHTGATIWVDENAHRNGPGTYDRPCASIMAAQSYCVADRGDVILVKPGHIDNYTAADDLILSVAGVAIVGLGTGTKQAKMSWDADAAQSVTAANISIINMWLYSAYAMVDLAFDVDAGGDYFTIQGCRVHDTSGSLEFENMVTLAAGANYFNFSDNLVRNLGGTDFILTKGECIDITIHNNNVIATSSAAVFMLVATALTGTPRITDNLIHNIDTTTDLAVSIHANTVCVSANNNFCTATGTVNQAMTTSTKSFSINNWEADEAAKHGILGIGGAVTAWS